MVKRSFFILLLSVMTVSVNAMQGRQQGAGVPRLEEVERDLEIGRVLPADAGDWTEEELRQHLGAMLFEGKLLTQEMIDSMVQVILRT